jgi:hypothetical protein
MKHTRLDSIGNIVVVAYGSIVLVVPLPLLVLLVVLPNTVPTVRTVTIPIVQNTDANPAAKAKVGNNVR